MKLHSVKLHDYLSFENAVYYFKKGCILVLGKNKTELSQETNGTGKTAFQSAIEYAITGNTSQKIRDKNLIRHSKSRALVILEIKCEVRSETLKIERQIFSNQSSKVSIFINNEQIMLATVIDANNYIMNWLMISKDDLQNYFIINRERYANFFQNSNTEKIKIISRFTHGNIIDNIGDYIRKDIDVLLAEKNDSLSEIDKLSTRIDAANESLEYEKNRNVKHENEVLKKDLCYQMLNLDQKCEKAENEMSDNINSINGLFDANKKIKVEIAVERKILADINISDLVDKIASIEQLIEKKHQCRDEQRDKVKVIHKELKETNKELSDVEKKLMGFVMCPVCHTEFIPFTDIVNRQEEEIKEKDLKHTIEYLNDRLVGVNNKLEEINALSDKLFDEKSVAQGKISKLEDEKDQCNRKINTLLNKIDQNKMKIDQLRNQNEINDKFIATCILKKETLMNDYNNFVGVSIDQKRIDELQSNIEKYQEEKTDYEAKVNELEQKIYKINQWNSNFKQFKQYLANRFLNVISTLCNDYLAKIDSDLRIKLEGFKLKFDGSFSERINAVVYRYNVAREFTSYSGGEKARLEMCMILAIRDLINQTHKFNGFDFLFTDEIFEGLDGLGLSQLTKAVEKLNSTIMMTTHVNNYQIHDNILLIEKNNGISTLHAS